MIKHVVFTINKKFQVSNVVKKCQTFRIKIPSVMGHKNDLSISFFRIIYQGIRIVYKSLHKSISEEIELSKEAARIRYENPSATTLEKSNDMSLTEAKQILNIENLDPIEVEKRFKFLYESNDRNNGGSFYLQSKVFRAKKRLEIEMEKTK